MLRGATRLRAVVRRRHDEGGFTLPEVLVGLTVLTIGVFATVNVFEGSLKVTASADTRTRAMAIATREVERMQGVPYAKVGFSAGQTGYQSAFEGASTVIVSSPAVTPTATETDDGVTFSIRRDIVWAADSSDASAFKRVVATVTWTDVGGVSHSVRQDAGVYLSTGASPSPSPSPSSSPTSTQPGTPTNLTATNNALNPSTAINLTWTAGSPSPTTWEIDYSTNGGTTWQVATTTQPGATTSYTLQGLSASTTYSLRVRGILNGVTGSGASTSLATQAAPSVCTVQAASVNPSPVSVNGSGKLQTSLSVSVNTTGSCSGLKVKYPPAASAKVMSQSGQVFSDTVAKNDYTWSVGSQTIQIQSSTGAVLAQIALCVTKTGSC